MVQPAAIREPLKFKPILHARIWGGDGLYHRLGKGTAGDGIGESWELSDRDGNASVVAEGPFAGQDLKDLFSRHARDILGTQFTPAGATGAPAGATGAPAGTAGTPVSPAGIQAGSPGTGSLARFPLLYKFIYARESLSVQVHPGEGSPLGESKTECWYILDAPENAHLILGVAGGHDRAGMMRALASKDCLSVLNKVPVKAGDLFHIPAGTVHAITAGLLLYEVQQNSDTTFRLYDWDRVDSSGKPRALHVKEAAQVLDLRSHDKHRIRPLALRVAGHREEMLVACRHFAVVRLSHCRSEASLGDRNRFRVVTSMRGAFTLAWDGGSATLGLGETVLVPAACPRPRLVETVPGSEALVSFLPELREDVFAPLLAAGHAPEAIRDLAGIDGLTLP